MSVRSLEKQLSITQFDRFMDALRELLAAMEYASDTASDYWDFAVGIDRLHGLGLTETDIRWLVRKGFVEHAREVTVEGDNGRQFRSTGDLTFAERSCVVLTELGARQARVILGDATCTDEGCCSHKSADLSSSTRPVWDPETRILKMNRRIVKRFKWRAANQEAILSVFQEEAWPQRIEDPLPPQPEQDSKRRLSDTIKCLNNKQVHRLIRFHGDGTGEGVTWERVAPADRSATAK